MPHSSDFRSEIAKLIVEVLNLEMDPSEIEPEAPLFYEGLGLDSIDALEMSLAISQNYGLTLRSDDPDNDKIFASLSSLSEVVYQRKTS